MPAPPSNPAGQDTPWAGPLALAAALVLAFGGMANRSLWTPDEPRVAEIGRAMAASGDWLVPRLAGEPFLEKPPLHWWIMSAGYRLLGVSDTTARLPSALEALLVYLLVYDLGRRMAGARAGLYALLALGTMLGWAHFSHCALVDNSLSLAVVLGYWAFFRGAFGGGRPPSAGWVLLYYLAMGLTFLAKGPIGPVLLGGPTVLAAAILRRGDLLRTWAHLPGLVTAAALCAAWPLGLYLRGGWPLLDGFFMDNVLGRVAQHGFGGHKRPFWQYLVDAPPGLLPWLLVLPAAWRHATAPEGPGPGPDRTALRAAAWIFPLGLLLLSIPGTKRELYLMPLLPALALPVGAWLAKAAARGLRGRLEAWAVAAAHTLWALVPGTLLAVLVALRVRPDLGRGLPGAADLAVGVAPAALVALAAYFLAVAWLGLRGAHLAVRGAGGAVGALVLLAFLNTVLIQHQAVPRLLEPFKTLHGFTAELVQAAPADLAAFQPDETTRAIVPYDTGRVLADLADGDALATWMREHPDGRVLVMAKHLGGISEDLRARLREVRRWTMAGGRAYVLYAYSFRSP